MQKLKVVGVMLSFPSIARDDENGNLPLLYEALKIPLVAKIDITKDKERPLLSELHALAQQHQSDGLVIGFHDSEFYVLDENQKIIESFQQYGADVVFGDGYPDGMTVWVIRREALLVMENIRQTQKIPLSRKLFTKIVHVDVNTFDLDNIYPSIALRSLRLSFFKDTIQNVDVAHRLKASPAMVALIEKSHGLYHFTDIANIIQDNKELLKTIPKYYEFTLTNRGQHNNTLFPPFSQIPPTKEGNLPYNDLSLADYQIMLTKAIAFSQHPVIALAGCGEPSLHPQWIEFVEATLASGMLCIIETSGEGFTNQLSDQLLQHPQKENLRVIFKLHGIHEDTEIRVTGSARNFSKRQEAIEYLLLRNPKNTYVEAVKVRENIEQISEFYSYFKRYTPNVLLAKYNSYRNALPERRDDPMRPFTHIDCWHLKRDVYIDECGDVWVCKQDFKKQHTLANLINDSMEKVFEQGKPYYAKHLKKWNFCANCDEGYTYNF